MLNTRQFENVVTGKNDVISIVMPNLEATVNTVIIK